MNYSKVPYSILLSAIPFLILLVSGCGKSGSVVQIDTEYTSVFLENGQIFVGKLEKAEPSYILLKDVFYIKSWVVQDKEDQSREIRNTISIRSKEPNNPAFTYINTQHILLIEPVSKKSKISDLIEKARAEQNAVP
jgi:hypothetical protein